MTDEDLFKHYQTSYYFEANRREQIFYRLNTPLAIIVATLGFYAVILSSNYKLLSLGGYIWFWVVFVVSAICLLVGGIFFTKVLLGATDKATATPNEYEKWRGNLFDYYKDESDPALEVSRLMKMQIYTDFMSCSTVMAINNDLKCFHLYLCNIFLISSVIASLVSYLIVQWPAI